MSRVVRVRAEREPSGSVWTRFADWLNWDLKQLAWTVFFFLFMGCWIAGCILRSAKGNWALGAPIEVLGRNGTRFTVSLLWAALLAVGCWLAGIVLIVTYIQTGRGERE
jgi:hypothetical protein